MGRTPIPLILTRPAGSNERFLECCAAQNASKFQVVLSPLIEISGTGASANLGDQDSAIFTSSNGVNFAPVGDGRVAFCVGTATTQAAAQAGWDSRCAGDDAVELIAFLGQLKPGGRLVHLSGVHTRGRVQERLSAAGLNVDRIEVYDQKLMSLSDQASDLLRNSDRAIVPLFSPRTAAHFAATCPPDAVPYLVFLSQAIGEKAAGLKVAGSETARNPEAVEMWRAIEKIAKRITLG